jgi:hypothetical protein
MANVRKHQGMPRPIWINAEILSWDGFRQSGSSLDETLYRRAYDIWEHAAKSLHHGADEMVRAVAITTLKRSLNQRLKVLEKIYHLNDFLKPKSTRYLQLLENLGLIRPLLLEDLIRVRNTIEHDDKKPPQLKRCLEMLDVVWYFLKTTDGITRERVESIVFSPEEGAPYWVEMDVTIKRNWTISIRGWLPESYISTITLPDHIEAQAIELHTNKLWKKRGKHLDKKDSDLYFSGQVISDKSVFARRYFSS